jgi:hypothetical protein
MFPYPHRIAVQKYLWSEVSQDAQSNLPWGPTVFDVLLSDGNGFSMRDYWSRTTFGLFELEFTVGRLWQASGKSQDALRNDRSRMVQAFRQLYLDDGGSLDGIDSFVFFLDPPPCDAGAQGRDAVLDQGGRLEMYQHEIGHVLGFMHSFGPSGVYGDPYCVMGATGPSDHPVQVVKDLTGFTFLDPAFWRSGRRVSAAALYRRFVDTSVGGSGDPRSGLGAAGFFDSRVVHTQLGRTEWVAALSEDGGQPVVAVAPLPQGVVAVEYRVRSGDDIGVTPAVVIHTLGVRPNEAGIGEVAPPRFEGTIDPRAGGSLTLAVGDVGYRVDLQAVRPDGPPGVQVALRAGFPVPVYPLPAILV